MSSDYCRDCDGKMSCNNYHVYVIELDRAVLEEKPDFPYEGNLPNDKKIFYVGITNIDPNADICNTPQKDLKITNIFVIVFLSRRLLENFQRRSSMFMVLI